MIKGGITIALLVCTTAIAVGEKPEDSIDNWFDATPVDQVKKWAQHDKHKHLKAAAKPGDQELSKFAGWNNRKKLLEGWKLEHSHDGTHAHNTHNHLLNQASVAADEVLQKRNTFKQDAHSDANTASTSTHQVVGEGAKAQEKQDQLEKMMSAGDQPATTAAPTTTSATDTSQVTQDVSKPAQHKMSAIARLKARKLVYDIKRLLEDASSIPGASDDKGSNAPLRAMPLTERQQRLNDTVKVIQRVERVMDALKQRAQEGHQHDSIDFVQSILTRGPPSVRHGVSHHTNEPMKPQDHVTAEPVAKASADDAASAVTSSGDDVTKDKDDSIASWLPNLLP